MAIEINKQTTHFHRKLLRIIIITKGYQVKSYLNRFKLQTRININTQQ